LYTQRTEPNDMDSEVRRALTKGGVIDVTTTGRRTGQPRRIEIVYHTIDGRIYITGMPRSDRTRAWLLNLESDPHLTVHLKGQISADLPATARIVTDEAERRAVFEYVVTVWKGQDVDTMTRYSPLIEVTFDDLAA
jgi:deazaflavin-dependent oxidoreductase (nitroreductase family)